MNISNAPAVLSIDIIFTWHSTRNQRKCQCRLRIYKITFEKAVVIVSGLPKNQDSFFLGEELTLINIVCNKFSLKTSKTMWVEHYPKGYLKEEETYEQLMLVAGNICSTRVDKKQIEALIGVRMEA